MKAGDKLICINNSLLIKGEIYYLDHVDIWDDKSIYVKDSNNMIYWAPIEHFMTLTQERKAKLNKLNEVNL